MTEPSNNPSRAIKGRGAVDSPPGRFETRQVDAVDDGWVQCDEPESNPQTRVRFESAKSILSENDSPDIPTQLSINPYRGCEHGCIYCFARPSHSYLGLSPGLDFETKLSAKQNAAELLRRALLRRNYRAQTITLGINTDAYQPIERRFKITRQLVELLCDCRHPLSLITKSALIERDIDLLSEMASMQLVEAAISITSLDATLTRKLEPRAAAPARRLKTVERLATAGIPVTVLMAPIIPALTDNEIESLLQSAKDAGAKNAGYIVLRLPHELKQVFRAWLAEHYPLRAKKIMTQVRALHGGADYNPEFFTRLTGRGEFANLIQTRFQLARKRCGLNQPRREKLRCDLFRPPRGGQMPIGFCGQ